MAIDKEKIKEHIRGIIEALGDDPNREGLIDTPKRVAEMYAEVFEGMNYTNAEIAQMFDKTFEDDLIFSQESSDMVIAVSYTHLHGHSPREMIRPVLYRHKTE